MSCRTALFYAPIRLSAYPFLHISLISGVLLMIATSSYSISVPPFYQFAVCRRLSMRFIHPVASLAVKRRFSVCF